MFVKYEDIVFNEETKEMFRRTFRSGATIGKKMSSPKFLVIDWRGADTSKIDFQSLIDLSEGDVDEEGINDDEVFKALFKKIETPNEEYLWNRLVSEFISNRVYQKNTYDENLNIYCKVRSVYKELLSK